MAAEYKTPGVYIEEKNAFPNSVVEVPTSIPVFVGYTQKAKRGNQDLTSVPTRISSMPEFEMLFGGAPKDKFVVKGDSPPSITLKDEARYFLYFSMRLFFDNGGGVCWIVSIGCYEDAPDPDALGKPFDAEGGVLEKEPEPSIVCVPDAVTLKTDGWAEVTNKMIEHCGRMQSRVAILDVYEGFKPLDNDPETDVIRGSRSGFRNQIASDYLNYAAAYYPWLNTSILSNADIGLDRFDQDSIAELSKIVIAESKNTDNERLEHIGACLVEPDPKDPPENPPVMSPEEAHNAALQICPSYAAVMEDALKQLNLLPPSAALAGVYARIDASIGVFKAPANTGLTSVISPAVTISHDEQEDLNVPLDGKAINAIRSFLGRGVLVWGARTLDGNSQDWRYVNVRRTMIMLEQSIKSAMGAYVFAPNDASTWITVQNMISNFLNNQWKAGALAGATPEEAYSVDVGLGSTMTPNDVLDGYMRAVIKVAVVRPAEFIVITYRQKMQTS